MLKFVSKQNLRLTVPKIALCVFAMGKGGGVSKRSDPCRKRLPFHNESLRHDERFPTSVKSKQKAWLLSGLRALKAPIVA